MELITAQKFAFEKDGKKVEFYQLVISTPRGFEVKKLSKALYLDICECEEYYCHLPFDSLLYDEWGRVGSIVKK